MAKDILPPAPPGEQKPVLKEKKKGFLNSLFGKKTQENQQETQPIPIAPSPNNKIGATGAAGQLYEIPDDINLDDIRKQLGLDTFSGGEIPEPPKMPDGQIKKESFDLPDIEAAIDSSKVEQPIIFEDGPVEEPDKILPMEIKPGEKKLGKKQAARAKPKKEINEWTQYIGEDKEANEPAPDFSTDLNLEKDQNEPPNEAGKKEFTQEVNQDDIKKLANELNRKKFDEKKAVRREPESITEAVTLPKAEEAIIGEKIVEKEEFLIDSSPGDEIINIKKRLMQKADRKETGKTVGPKPQLPAKEEEKPEAKVIEEELELPDLADERRVGGKLSILENESSDESRDIPEEKLAESPIKRDASFETPSYIETGPDKNEEHEKKSADTSELIKEMEKSLVEKIRSEEKAVVENEFEQDKAVFEQEKQAFEKAKQALEQEKIAVAGKANRYDFKEKQLKRDKAEIEAEKAKLKRDKEEADDILKKLPIMRKDYEKLSDKMTEVYEVLKKYSKKEAELRDIEQNIEINKQNLADAQQRLEETEQKIKDKGFSQYLETELKEEPLVSQKLEEAQDITRASNLEIYNLIDECKAKIRDKNISEAKKLYMRIREAYNMVNIQGTEKDLLYTAVRELYDDIKLAEMESNDFNFQKL